MCVCACVVGVLQRVIPEAPLTPSQVSPFSSPSDNFYYHYISEPVCFHIANRTIPQT